MPKITRSEIVEVIYNGRFTGHATAGTRHYMPRTRAEPLAADGRVTIVGDVQQRRTPLAGAGVPHADLLADARLHDGRRIPIATVGDFEAFVRDHRLTEIKGMTSAKAKEIHRAIEPLLTPSAPRPDDVVMI